VTEVKREKNDLQITQEFLERKLKESGRSWFSKLIDRFIIFTGGKLLKSPKFGVVLLRLIVRWGTTGLADLGADVILPSSNAEVLVATGTVIYDCLILDRLYIAFMDAIYVMVVLSDNGFIRNTLGYVHKAFLNSHPAWWQNWLNAIIAMSWLLGCVHVPVFFLRFFGNVGKNFVAVVFWTAFFAFSFFKGLDTSWLYWLGFTFKNHGKVVMSGWSGLGFAWLIWAFPIGCYMMAVYIKRGMRESIDD